jgi:hypothetical protein
MRKVLILAVTLALAPSGGQAQPTSLANVQSLLRTYDAAPAEGRAFIETFVSGREQGLLVANSYLVTIRHEKPMYCQPDRLTLMPEQIIDMLRRESAADPTLAGLPVEDGILLTLVREFPCQ